MTFKDRWKKIKRVVRRPFEWLGIWLGVLILSSLPHKWLLGVCDFLSAVMYMFDGRGKRRSLQNLRIAFGRVPKSVEYLGGGIEYNPTKREETIIRRSYRNMARTIGHAFWTCHNARRRVEAVGEMSESVREFLKANNPAVTVSGHIGCWEILSQLAFLEGHKMMSVAKDIGSKGMTSLLMKARTSIGQEIVNADGAFRPLMDGLKHGKSLGLLVDQCVQPKHGGMWIRFLGRPLPVSAAPAFFAAKCKTPIIVAWSRPLKDGRYRCELVDTITAGEARDIWGATQRCARDLEMVIRRHPSCWVLNYNLYSNVPSLDDIAELERREKGRKQ